MTYEELLDIAVRLRGRPLTTVTGREFTVGVYLGCPLFTPASTGRGRRDDRKAALRFLTHYNATGSLRPGDYTDLTRNASYYVALLQEAARARR